MEDHVALVVVLERLEAMPAAREFDAKFGAATTMATDSVSRLMAHGELED
jgi:hypothetical protein